jgi:hypothetical protein
MTGWTVFQPLIEPPELVMRSIAETSVRFPT